MGAEVSAFSIW